jgi:Na+-transporting NADH:ubiquinone oxidoreductase subunit F
VLTKSRDYRLVGSEGTVAQLRGLVDAQWHMSPVSPTDMAQLTIRRDGPAIRDTLIWVAIILVSAFLVVRSWGSWFVLPSLFIYGTIYASSADSRWHETAHGTPFKTDWMNAVLYEIASFMMLRESWVWKWSHVRHHSDTLIVGRDPEIAAKRNRRDLINLLLRFSGLQVPSVYFNYFRLLVKHALNGRDPEAAQYVPDNEWPKVTVRARAHLLVYCLVIGCAVFFETWLPVILIFAPRFMGSWLILLYSLTQHTGLAEDVTDHRRNCRTVKMNPINRFLYSNMNYHLEHHMYPLVPYYSLPKLHELIKDDCPPPYNGIIEAWREIIPAVMRQMKDPTYFVERPLPTVSNAGGALVEQFSSSDVPSADGWVAVCPVSKITTGSIIRFNHGDATYAVYRTHEGELFATDGICSHGNTHLSEGVLKGEVVECPKHNGRFNVRTGEAVKVPACVRMRTYEVDVSGGYCRIRVLPFDLPSEADEPQQRSFLVVRNDDLTPFVKELLLLPLDSEQPISYRPGDYLSFKVPQFDARPLSNPTIDPRFKSVWEQKALFEFSTENRYRCNRNFSLASNPVVDGSLLKFNVRLALPPLGSNFPAGAGSSFIFGLKPGDVVQATGPFGDFHPKEGINELVYVGAGAGMAPLRSHISHHFDTAKTKRNVSFWYGARDSQQIYYREYFERLMEENENFSFHIAYSDESVEPGEGQSSGYVHDVLQDRFLDNRERAMSAEYYLCGPPAMMRATRARLLDIGVPESQINYDEF